MFIGRYHTTRGTQFYDKKCTVVDGGDEAHRRVRRRVHRLHGIFVAIHLVGTSRIRNNGGNDTPYCTR